MVSEDLARNIDEGIKQTEKSISEFPDSVKTRIVSLKALPNEVISRIQQIDGLIVEFEER